MGICRGGGGMGSRWAGGLPWGALTPLPRQLEAREQPKEQHLKELVEGIKVESTEHDLQCPEGPLVSSPGRGTGSSPGSIMSHKTSGILMSSGGRATSSNVGHVTAGDSTSVSHGGTDVRSRLHRGPT